MDNDDQDTYIDTLVFPDAGFDPDETTKYTFTVTDENGESVTKTFNVTVEAGTVQLGSAQSFTWEREGSNPGTGLSQFGLKWTSNTAQSAIIAEDAATKMVELSANDWTAITTQEGLDDAITNGTAITEYDGVSVQQGGTYNDVLGVAHNGTNYLIQIQSATVNTSGGSGTKVTIMGEYKE